MEASADRPPEMTIDNVIFITHAKKEDSDIATQKSDVTRSKVFNILQCQISFNCKTENKNQ